MGTFPILLTKPKLLLIGGGQIALQKAQALSRNQINFNIIASAFCHEIQALDIPMTHRPVCAEDFAGVNIVIDATGNPDVAKLVLQEKKKSYFLFNCVSQPELGDVYFPAILNVNDLKISVSTDGASPTISRIVRDKIAAFIPKQIPNLLAEKRVERQLGTLDIKTTQEQCLKLFSTVYLIGCGPGDVDLMTIKAYKTLQQMDVVFYDHLLTPEILALIPETTQKISVGKKKGCHLYRQEQINELLFEHAKRGLKIARLKCGDPYIFGRGAEEAEYLIKKGIKVEMISGISSALAGPACAGIPPTARNYATNMSIVSAHLAGCKINTDWLPLLKIPHHTIIVLMGLSFATQISELSLASGVNPQLPVAIISNASRADQDVRITDMQNLPTAAVGAQRPAILVIGDVVRLHEILSFASRADEGLSSSISEAGRLQELAVS
ncbi:uroporphyrinogen-III C-methyltransferase [Desulfuromusa kysingii]|uniref:Uroporphyrinogen-III C-methyltransferase n=1 Tax=Desulfuromusa kysingii TaxID=37625 RepID=A0A1H4AIW5_9BACT|nr:uroporphyrinogen-III C-methyltransferase [Desulfuromusa kysingii]SEA35718.1 uroporphyrinogen-III C-methyltransferase [Desulfuromusa kysingii]